MIGQKKLKDEISKINCLDDIPKSIIVQGEAGSGRHTFIEELFAKYSIGIVDIELDFSPELLDYMYTLSIPKVYIIDIDKIAENKRIERFQNTILKFLEEPPEFAWIVVLVEDIESILPTVVNRCQLYKLFPYSVEELRQISNEYNKNYTDSVLKVLKTPGNIINKDISQLNEIFDLAINIVKSIGNATPSNALSIRDKFIRDDNPLDLDIFINIILEEFSVAYNKSNYDNKYFESYIATLKFKKDLKVIGVNKKYLIDNYLVNLKDIYARFS